MSEPYWVALGAGGAVDYAGEWAAGTAYPAGSVVSKDGFTYLAVNPSTGQTPPSVPGQTPGLVKLFDQTLGAPAASFDIIGIPQTYAHLRLALYLRSDTAASVTEVRARFNNDSAANYSTVYHVTSNTASPAEQFNTPQCRFGRCPAASSPASSFMVGTVEIPNYAGTVGHKAGTAQGASREGTATGGFLIETDGFSWFATPAAINRITVYPQAGNWIAGCRVTLYGMV